MYVCMCMYVCMMCVYVYVCMHVCKYVYIYIYIYIYKIVNPFAIYEYTFRADGQHLTFGYHGTQSHIKPILKFNFLSVTVPFTPNHF